MAEPTTNRSSGDAPTPSGRTSARFREVPIAAVLVLVFGWLLLTMGDHITGREVGAYVSAEFWPRVLLVLGLGLSLIYLVRTVWAGVREAPPTVGAAKPNVRLGSLAAAAGILAAYIVLMQIVGFVPVTLVFGVAFLLLTGERRWWMLTGLPVLTVALVLAAFTRLLVVPLPRGVGPFLEFSTWLY